MINKTNIIVEGILETYTFPKFKYFFYKCLKRISRYYYENPKNLSIDESNMISNLTSKQTILELIRNVVYNLLPMKQIMTILEYKDLINEDKESYNKEIVEYNFDDVLTSSSKSHESMPKIIIEKQLSQCSLQYISSDEFDKEYCKSETEHLINEKQNTEEDFIKHVNIPKIKKNKNLYYKKNRDDIDEYFFD